MKDTNLDEQDLLKVPTDLITQVAAAKLVRVTVAAIGNRIRRGQLLSYVDPNERNTQRNKRVSRAAVINAYGLEVHDVTHGEKL